MQHRWQAHRDLKLILTTNCCHDLLVSHASPGAAACRSGTYARACQQSKTQNGHQTSMAVIKNESLSSTKAVLWQRYPASTPATYGPNVRAGDLLSDSHMLLPHASGVSKALW